MISKFANQPNQPLDPRSPHSPHSPHSTHSPRNIHSPPSHRPQLGRQPYPQQQQHLQHRPHNNNNMNSTGENSNVSGSVSVSNHGGTGVDREVVELMMEMSPPPASPLSPVSRLSHTTSHASHGNHSNITHRSVGNGHSISGLSGNRHDMSGLSGNGHNMSGYSGNGHNMSGYSGNGRIGNGHNVSGNSRNGYRGNGHSGNGQSVSDGHIGNGHHDGSGLNGSGHNGSWQNGSSGNSRIASAMDDLLSFQKQPPPSLSVSRATLQLTSREFGVEKSLTAMGILALIAVIMSGFSILLLVQFNTLQDQVRTDNTAMLVGVTGARWYEDVLDSGVVLASFCLTLNLCCVVVCTGQSYFTAKMLKLPQGEERSCDFLQNTSGSRFLAICSFFISIPVFLVAMCLYVLLEFRMIPASVSTALVGLAVLFMTFSFCHNVYLWRGAQADINKRHVPPPGVFSGLNGGIPNQQHGQSHHHQNQQNHQINQRGVNDINHRHNDANGTTSNGAANGRHRFAYTNHVTGDADDDVGGGGGGDVDPLSVSNLSTLV